MFKRSNWFMLGLLALAIVGAVFDLTVKEVA